MSRFAPAIAAMCLALAAAAPLLLAECAGHASLEQVIARSDLIFVGTVQDITSMRVHLRDQESPGGTVMTGYRFRQNRYIKGAGSPDTLSLIGDGGSDGGLLYVDEHAIRLELGKRYVIFAARDTRPRLPGTYYQALLCVDHYTIDADSSGWSVGLLRMGESHSSSRLVAFDTRHMVWMIDRVAAAKHGLSRPRLPLAELLRRADSAESVRVAAARGSMPDSVLDQQRVQHVWIDPNQDPGTRVTEEQLADTLRVIVDRLSR
ncbi:MAG TPA: hypothetical protein VE326_02545 [Candidatus Binatia bacterium]|nr:hypothetical protein [Candidatus Binatia bacterium]